MVSFQCDLCTESVVEVIAVVATYGVNYCNFEHTQTLQRKEAVGHLEGWQQIVFHIYDNYHRFRCQRVRIYTYSIYGEDCTVVTILHPIGHPSNRLQRAVLPVKMNNMVYIIYKHILYIILRPARHLKTAFSDGI